MNSIFIEKLNKVRERKSIEVGITTFDTIFPSRMGSLVNNFESDAVEVNEYRKGDASGFTISQFCGSKYITQFFLTDINC